MTKNITMLAKLDHIERRALAESLKAAVEDDPNATLRDALEVLHDEYQERLLDLPLVRFTEMLEAPPVGAPEAPKKPAKKKSAKKKAPPKAGPKKRRSQEDLIHQIDQLEELACGGSLTRAQIRKELNCGGNQINAVIEAMLSTKSLEASGPVQMRNTTYRLTNRKSLSVVT